MIDKDKRIDTNTLAHTQFLFFFIQIDKRAVMGIVDMKSNIS